jgi:hypothetical protein
VDDTMLGIVVAVECRCRYGGGGDGSSEHNGNHHIHRRGLFNVIAHGVPSTSIDLQPEQHHSSFYHTNLHDSNIDPDCKDDNNNDEQQ